MTKNCVQGFLYFGKDKPVIRPFSSGRSGKISLITVFTLLLFAVLIIYVANVGRAVNDKIELQNAADATAYSTAIWKARSLNAITTTNHLMGELTAMTVVLDSFGGPMLGDSSAREHRSDTSRKIYEELKKFSDANLDEKLPLFVNPTLGDLDKQIVDNIVGPNGLMTESKGYHLAGAAIYDAKLALQNWATVIMWSKSKANIALEIAAVLEITPFAAFGYAIEAAAVVVHGYMTAKLGELAKEWLILDATENAISVVNAEGILKKAVFDGALPALSIYADSVVGSNVIRKLGGTSPASFRKGVLETRNQLVAVYRLNSAKTFPSWHKMKLPVIEEEPPATNQDPRISMGEWGFPDSYWTGNFTASNELNDIRKKIKPINDVLKKINDVLKPFKRIFNTYKKAKNRLGGSLPIPEFIKEYAGYFDKYDRILRSLESLNIPDKLPMEFGGNPCKEGDPKHRLPKFYWQAEQKSQWVRATYPYVDEYRAPVIGFFKKECKYSDFATYYSHWSNRYTLANSYLARRPKNPSNRNANSTAGILKQLKALVAKLRRKFEDATDQTAEENAGFVDTNKFIEVSNQLKDVLRFRGQLTSLASWFDQVAKHQQDVIDLGQSVSAPPGSTIPEDTIKGLAEEMARINVLDELLNLLEDLVALLELEEPHMYVLQDMEPETKGEMEPWLNNPKVAKKMFCVSVKVTRDAPKIFGSGLFAAHGATPREAYATAMVYNANGRELRLNSNGAQPNTGWDTLNWAPPVNAPEWGDHRPSSRTDLKPWQLIKARSASNQNKVKVNWKVKLVPFDTTKLKDKRYESLFSH